MSLSTTASYFYKPLINSPMQDAPYQNRSDSVFVAGDISQQYKLL